MADTPSETDAKPSAPPPSRAVATFTALRELESELTPVTLGTGEVLFEQGDAGDALYLVRSGRLEITVRGRDGKPVVLDELKDGSIVGEMALMTGQPRVATVRATAETRLGRLTRGAFDSLTRRHPEAYARLAGALLARFERSQLVTVLGNWLGPIDAAITREILDGSTLQHLVKGEVLYQEGEPGDALFLVVDGRLALHARARDGSTVQIGLVNRGESAGELAALTDEPREATARAVRDTVVVRIPRDLVQRQPLLLGPIARTLAKQGQHRRVTGSRPDGETTIIALVPTNPHAPLNDVAEKLAVALAEWGPTLFLDSRRLDEQFGRDGAAQATDGQGLGLTLGAWLKEREARHRWVLYQADRAPTRWSERCTRRADRVVLVGAAGSDPYPGEQEGSLARLLSLTPTELVVVQPDSAASPAGTLEWLAPRQVEAHHHVRLGVPGDLGRLARRLTGNALGVVLSGGGARGFAHIGLLRALEERGMEDDAIGGTSIGALAAGMYAVAGNSAACATAAASFGRPRALIDYTLPLVALTSSRGVTTLYRHLFEDRRIEDLWLPFFCMSTNLTRAHPVVHERGLLWRAVRASSAIPGVFTPVAEGGDLLVDGGVMNNLPIDVMRQRVGSGKVIASVASPREENPPAYDFDDSLSGWRLLWERVSHPTRPRLPSIVGTLARATSVTSQYLATSATNTADLVVEHRTADYGLLQFDQHIALIELGYRGTRAALDDWMGQPAANTPSAAYSEG